MTAPPPSPCPATQTGAGAELNKCTACRSGSVTAGRAWTDGPQSIFRGVRDVRATHHGGKEKAATHSFVLPTQLHTDHLPRGRRCLGTLPHAQGLAVDDSRRGPGPTVTT